MKIINSKGILNVIIPMLIFLLALIGISETFSDLMIVKTLGDIVQWIIQTASFVIMILILVTIMLSINSTDEFIFTKNNVKRFNRLGYMFMILTAFEYIRTIITKQIFLGAVINIEYKIIISGSMCIIMILGLLCFLIADSFQKAINIKEENDLTI